MAGDHSAALTEGRLEEDEMMGGKNTGALGSESHSYSYTFEPLNTKLV